MSDKERAEERRTVALKLAVETMHARPVEQGAIFETGSRVLWLANEYQKFIENGTEQSGPSE
jgi:hypothetical protein